MNVRNLAAELVFDRRTLDKPCFVGPGYSMSYGEFDRAVRRQAARMQREGVVAGETVVIALDDGPVLASVFFAALALGALPATVNPRLGADPLSDVLRDARPAAVYAGPAQGAVARRELDRAQSAASLHLPAEDAWCAWADAADDADARWNAVVDMPEDAPALLQYTSGSTGRPKGVMHSAGGVLACCAAFAGRLAISATDVLYSVPKIFFGYGMGNSLFFPLYAGATAVLDPVWPTGERVRENLRRFSPTVLFAVPTMYRMLLDAGAGPADAPLRLAFSAGAPLPEPTAARWRQIFGSGLHDGIGATELCHVFVSTYPDDLREGSLGRPLPECAVRIVGEGEREAAPGEVGVLLVRAPFAALGYWRRPPELPSGFGSDGWYRTGDLFSRDADGFMYFHGREDDRFKVYGRWVVPVEIEVLIGRHAPELGMCFVVPGRDATGEDSPVLCIHGRPEAAEVERVLAILRRTLERHVQPAAVLLLDTLPLTPNGKPDRRAIVRLANGAVGRETRVEDALPC